MKNFRMHLVDLWLTLGMLDSLKPNNLLVISDCFYNYGFQFIMWIPWPVLALPPIWAFPILLSGFLSFKGTGNPSDVHQTYCGCFSVLSYECGLTSSIQNQVGWDTHSWEVTPRHPASLPAGCCVTHTPSLSLWNGDHALPHNNSEDEMRAK